MPQLFNAASGIINAFMQGAMLKRQMEQDALAKEQWGEEQKLKTDRQKEEKRQFDEQQKAIQQRLKQAENEAKADAEFRQQQTKLQLAKHKLDLQSALGSGVLQFPTQRANWAEQNAPEVKTPYTDETTGVSVGPSEVPTMEQRLQQMEAEKRATYAPQMEMQEMLMGGRLSAADEANRMREMIAEQNNATRLMIAGMRQNGNQAVNEEGLESLLQQGMSGGINIDRLGTKTRERLMVEAGKRGIYLQPEKFKEDSKKLSETANFINLVRQAFKSNPKDTESLASSVALVHALNQQIGTLGAMFPQLGRLSDNDINILRTGLPTAKSLVLKRIFPKFSTEYYGGLENALVAGMAKRVEAHLANVTNPDEKHRLTTQYGLYTPGMEKYITRRKQ